MRHDLIAMLQRMQTTSAPAYRRLPIFAAGVFLFMQAALNLLMFPLLIGLQMQTFSISITEIYDDLTQPGSQILAALNRPATDHLTFLFNSQTVTIPKAQVLSALFIPFALVAVPIVLTFWLRRRRAWTMALMLQVLILTLCMYLHFNHPAEYLYPLMGPAFFRWCI